ncbi:MAG: hypothetical protein FWE89_05840 [Syntrophaceae bacterium]|nr:hypothetical protein [Syntrophaceae bacterium]
MKMVLIIYDKATDEDVITAIKAIGIQGYTKGLEMRGEGTETDPKLGTHYWPGKNNLLMIALADEEIPKLKDCLHRLKEEHPRAGVRSFIMPLEEMN